MTTRPMEPCPENRLPGLAAPGGSRRYAETRSLAQPALGPWAEELLSLVGDGVISTDDQGMIILFNEAAAEMFGYRADEVLGQPVEILLPPQYLSAHHQAVVQFGASATFARRSMARRRDVLGRKKSGEEFAVEASLSRRTMEGRQLLTVALRDVSEQKRIEEERRLVTTELSHRFKNCLAVVNSVISLSARDADTVEAFQEILHGRLRAIALAQDLLFDECVAGPDLRQLLEAELKPYASGKAVRISLSGPAVIVPARMAVRLTLALHELATNAAKYGALSKSGGSLTISWHVHERPGGPVLLLDWNETGGPAVEPTGRRGFGSELIERCLGSANVQLSFLAQGLAVAMKLPLEPDQRD